jgi:hypothetical protein
MRITVRQLKGLIREAVREVSVKRIHENANSVEDKKTQLISKWKGSDRSNGMPDWEWAQQMYQTGVALETGDDSDLQSSHMMSVEEMQGHYPLFTAKDFKEVAIEVDPDAAS